jgi:hypothetical protein
MIEEPLNLLPPPGAFDIAILDRQVGRDCCSRQSREISSGNSGRDRVGRETVRRKRNSGDTKMSPAKVIGKDGKSYPARRKPLKPKRLKDHPPVEMEKVAGNGGALPQSWFKDEPKRQNQNRPPEFSKPAATAGNWPIPPASKRSAVIRRCSGIMRSQVSAITSHDCLCSERGARADIAMQCRTRAR